MKYFIAILLLALVAVIMAVEKTPEAEKTSQAADVARDKRGLAYYSPYTYAPYAYSAYNLPYAYSPYNAYSPYTYPYYRYPHSYYNSPYYY